MKVIKNERTNDPFALISQWYSVAKRGLRAQWNKWTFVSQILGRAPAVRSALESGWVHPCLFCTQQVRDEEPKSGRPSRRGMTIRGRRTRGVILCRKRIWACRPSVRRRCRILFVGWHSGHWPRLLWDSWLAATYLPWLSTWTPAATGIRTMT